MAVTPGAVESNIATGGTVTLNVPDTIAVLNSAGNSGRTYRSNIINKYDSRYLGMNFKEQSAVLLTIANPTADTVEDDDTAFETYGTNQFLLTSIREAMNEKVQILETFGAPSFYFFDERTKVYNIAGSLLEANPSNTHHNLDYKSESDFTQMRNISKDWTDGFKEFWNKHLRGSKLAEANRIALLAFGNDMMYGYPVSLNITKHSANPNNRVFSMSMIVVDHRVKESFKYYYTPYLNEDILMKLQLQTIVAVPIVAELASLSQLIVGTASVLTFFNVAHNARKNYIEERQEEREAVNRLEQYDAKIAGHNDSIAALTHKIRRLREISNEVMQQVHDLSMDSKELRIKLEAQ